MKSMVRFLRDIGLKVSKKIAAAKALRKRIKEARKRDPFIY